LKQLKFELFARFSIRPGAPAQKTAEIFFVNFIGIFFTKLFLCKLGRRTRSIIAWELQGQMDRRTKPDKRQAN
jgi:hypothetical protein